MTGALPISFYTREDVTLIAKELLGKVLCTNINGVLTSGIIAETEAYSERERACHAFGGKRTPRTSTFYHDGGIAYVYLCYGIHHLFNIVTNTASAADAVLIRAIEPLDDIKQMLKRRNISTLKPALTSGPGSVAKALGIDKIHNGINLTHTQSAIWIENRSISIEASNIVACKRIGVDYAGDDALLLWRYYIKDNLYVSKPIKQTG